MYKIVCAAVAGFLQIAVQGGVKKRTTHPEVVELSLRTLASERARSTAVAVLGSHRVVMSQQGGAKVLTLSAAKPAPPNAAPAARVAARVAGIGDVSGFGISSHHSPRHHLHRGYSIGFHEPTAQPKFGASASDAHYHVRGTKPEASPHHLRRGFSCNSTHKDASSALASLGGVPANSDLVISLHEQKDAMVAPSAPRGSVFALPGDKKSRVTPSLTSSLHGGGAIATSEQVAVASIGGDGGRSGFFSPRSGRRSQRHCIVQGTDRQRDHLGADCCPSPAAGTKPVTGDRHRRTFTSSPAIGGVSQIGAPDRRNEPTQKSAATAGGSAGSSLQTLPGVEPLLSAAVTAAPVASAATNGEMQAAPGTPAAAAARGDAPRPRTPNASLGVAAATQRNLGAAFGHEGPVAPLQPVSQPEATQRRAPSAMGNAMAAASAAAATVASSPRHALSRRSNAWVESPATPLSFFKPTVRIVAPPLPAVTSLMPEQAAELPEPAAEVLADTAGALAAARGTAPPSRCSNAWMETAAAPTQFSPVAESRYTTASGLVPTDPGTSVVGTAPPPLPPVQRSTAPAVGGTATKGAASNLLSQDQVQDMRATEAAAAAAKNVELAAQREATRSKARNDDLEDGRARAEYAIAVKTSADAAAAQLRATRIQQAKADATKFEAMSSAAQQQAAKERASVSASAVQARACPAALPRPRICTPLTGFARLSFASASTRYPARQRPSASGGPKVRR